MFMKPYRKILVLLTCFLLAPAASALAIPTNNEPQSELVTGYDDPKIINRNVGMSILPDSLVVYENDRWNLRESQGSDVAKSLIPGYIVDQYMKTTEIQKTPRSAVQQGGSAASYVIQKGDTLYRIANKFGVHVDLLMIENRISDPTKLRIGQKLSIPVSDVSTTAWLDGNSAIKDVFYATLTAYTAGYESTGKTPSHPQYGITASGAKVKENQTIAVDPKVIPLGSLVYIDGIGIRKAEDTGSAIKGHKIDVYIPDLDEALEFGVKKNVKVYVLAPEKKNDVFIASANP